MMKIARNRYIILVLFYLCNFQSRAAFEDTPIGARQAGIGSACVAVTGGPDQVFANPAATAKSTHATISIFYSRLFDLKELTYQTISSTIPTKTGNINALYYTFGSSLYHESIMAFGWNHTYQKILHYGILFRSTYLQIERYGSANGLMIDLGCMIEISQQVMLGFNISNMNRGKMGKTHDSLPQTMAFGLSFKIPQGYLLSFELNKDTRYPMEIRGGCEITLLSRLSLRFGYGNTPTLTSYGLGISLSHYRFDYALVNHPVLGVTHMASLSIHLKNNHAQ